MRKACCGEWFEDFFAGLTGYYLTSLPVFLGILFGIDFPHPADVVASPRQDIVSSCVCFDAVYYVQIAREGYTYDSARRSSVAFFPAYPLLGHWMSQATGLSVEQALLLTANMALLGVFVLLVRYVRVRWPEATADQRGVVVSIFGLWPTGLFFRMPYAESLFLCVTLIFLYGLVRGWPLPVLALLAGLGTAIRPVGVALTAAFAWHILMQQRNDLLLKATRLLFFSLLASWGLLAYMGYQWLAFDAPLAFAKTQEHWLDRAPEDRIWTVKLRALVSLEPIWNVYVPSSERYWGNGRSPSSPLFSLFFWNPILFVLAAALLAWGGKKRWLSGSEFVLGAVLLAIPYLTRSYEMSMASHGRFAAVIIVNYLVLGRMLSRSAHVVVASLCAILALFLFTFTFLYTMRFLIF